MFTKRIIPCLDVNGGRVVKGVNFVDLKDAGDPVEIAKAYDKAGADELVFLDITASSDERRTVIDMVRKVAECVFIPFTVGGGIRTVDDFRAILREGADKVSVNSSAINTPELVQRCGGQVREPVRGRGHRRQAASRTDPGWNIYKNGGRVDVGDRRGGVGDERWSASGAGEILLTSMDCDGTKAGYDLELTRKRSRSSVSVPVIASGGAGDTGDTFKDALTVGKADAALAASLFHYKELEIREVKEYLRGRRRSRCGCSTAPAGPETGVRMMRRRRNAVKHGRSERRLVRGAERRVLRSRIIGKLFETVNQEYRTRLIFPPAEDIFNAFHLTPLKKVKVVILGQDPYHNNGQAHGCASR